MVTESNIFKSIYNEVYNLFPKDNDERRFSYVRRNWIFPNHFQVMLDLAKNLCKKYDANYEICSIAIILHDTGLAYKRTTASSLGHEEKSIEYANIMLDKYNVTDKEEILACINATNPRNEPSSINEKIVRSVDAMSQFMSVHFFAKAAFSGEWNSYINWFEKKVKNNFKKICLEDEKKETKPIKEYMERVISEYRQRQSN